jgi:integrase
MSNRLESTKYANLARDGVSKTYFCRAKVHGQKICKSLKTTSVEIAKIRLAELLKTERERLGRIAVASPTEDGDTFKTIADDWRAEIESDTALKPASKLYRTQTLDAIRETWPELDGMKPHAVTEAMCQDLAARLRKRFSSGRFNGCVETLRAIFRRAILRGHAAFNPAMSIERIPVTIKPKKLPPAGKLHALLKALDDGPWSQDAALSVRFLVFGGARPTASSQVKPGDVNLEKNEITFPPIKYQHQPLTVPMSKELRAVVEKLLARHPGDDSPLLPIADPKKALARACEDVGIPRLTRYDLRHLFTTHMLESGVPVPTVAALRGDKDGGAMLLKTYFHARQEAMHRAVKGVEW